MLTRRSARVLSAATIVALTCAVGAPPAAAHVGTDRDEITAAASTTLAFSIGHGCEASPTTSMRIQIPAGVMNAAPVVKPGWTIEIEKETLTEPVESAHGDSQTDRTAIITFTAQDGNAVPDGHRDSFSIAFAAPAEPGLLHFKTIQGCESGENAWIDEWDGTGTEPEHPAPTVTVVAGDGDASATGAVAARDDDSNVLAIVALVVGALGLVAGGAALVTARRGRTT